MLWVVLLIDLFIFVDVHFTCCNQLSGIYQLSIIRVTIMKYIFTISLLLGVSIWSWLGCVCFVMVFFDKRNTRGTKLVNLKNKMGVAYIYNFSNWFYLLQIVAHSLWTVKMKHWKWNSLQYVNIYILFKVIG